MSRRRSLVAALALGLAPSLAGAQIIPMGVASAPRHTIGGALIYGQPLGDFRQNVKRGLGLDGAGTFGIDARGIFSLRGEIGYQQYSSKSEYFVVNTGFGLAELESETKSTVMTAGIGPQLSGPVGATFRPYIAATVGFARFATETSINLPAQNSNTGQKQTLDKQTVSSDWILSLGGAGGFTFAPPMLARSGVMLDLGVRYHRNGLAKYVTSEGVEYNGTGVPTVTATESEADFLVYRVGIVMPIGGGRR